MRSHPLATTLLTTLAGAVLAVGTAGQAGCQQQKVMARDGRPQAEFGMAFSMDGPAVVIDAWDDNVLGVRAGAAYVYEKFGPAWIETARLTASDGGAGDRFGVACGMSLPYVVVAAIGDDDRGSNAGASYIFEKMPAGWIQTHKLTASDGAANDQFGFFADISGTYALVTARWDDDNGFNSGSAYIYEKIGANWVERPKLLPADGGPRDEFGYGCAIDGNVAVITAIFDDDRGADAGAAYVFERIGGTWIETAKLLASDASAGDQFGGAAAIQGDVILVGAWGNDDNGADSGAAYVFERQGANWVETAKLLPSDGSAGDFFGGGTGVSETAAVVSSSLDDDNGTSSGSAYLFVKQGSSWVERAKLLPSDGAAFDEFGFQCELDGDNVVVGSRRDDDLGTDSGSAYFFSVSGTACPTLTGDRAIVPLSTGGVQSFSLDAGPALGGLPYLLLGSVTGTWPGFTFAGFNIPLNVDGYTITTITNPVTLIAGAGTLDIHGRASAGFVFPPGFPQLQGIELNHAYIVLDAANCLRHASNPLAVRLVP